jgi:hypothetical protein
VTRARSTRDRVNPFPENRARLACAVLLACASACFPEAAVRAKEQKSPPWTVQDSLDASAIVSTLLLHPEAVDSLTAGSLTRDHALGFGRHLREAWVNPAGKLGFAFKIYYEGAIPVSFEAKAVLNYAGLRARYLASLAPAFRPPAGRPEAAPEPFYWNLEKAARPLAADTVRLGAGPLPSPAILEAFSFYMTPYSGILYGIRGGQAGQLLENRDRFIGLTGILTADRKLARYLLRSVNPASRLTAAEFIVRNKEGFPEFDSLQLTAFRAVFASPPKAATLRGSLEASEDPRKLVFECARREASRDGRGILRMY